MAKSHTLQGFAIFLFWLHTARTENPETPLTHLSASNFHEYYSQHSQTPPIHHPDTPQTASGNTTCQQTTTDANRHNQTCSNSTFQCLAVSGSVWRCLFASVGVCWHVMFPGAIWGVSGGCLGGFWECSERQSWKLEALGCVGCIWALRLSVWSQNTNLAKSWKVWLFVTWP